MSGYSSSHTRSKDVNVQNLHSISSFAIAILCKTYAMKGNNPIIHVNAQATQESYPGDNELAIPANPPPSPPSPPECGRPLELSNQVCVVLVGGSDEGSGAVVDEESLSHESHELVGSGVYSGGSEVKVGPPR
jgi:hypothetical protein